MPVDVPGDERAPRHDRHARCARRRVPRGRARCRRRVPRSRDRSSVWVNTRLPPTSRYALYPARSPSTNTSYRDRSGLSCTEMSGVAIDGPFDGLTFETTVDACNRPWIAASCSSRPRDGGSCWPPCSAAAWRNSTARSSTSRCPRIGADLDAGLTSLQWTLNAYTLTLAGLLLLGGSLGDRLGRRRIFVIGTIWFAARLRRLRARADRRHPDRDACAAGHRRRAAHARIARDPRGGLPSGRSRRGGRRVVRPRRRGLGDRPGARRRAGRGRAVGLAARVPDQPSAGGRGRAGRRAARAGDARRAGAAAGSTSSAQRARRSGWRW